MRQVLLSSFLWILAFPPFSAWPLIFIAPVPLFYLEIDSSRKAAVTSFLWSTLTSAGLSFWILTALTSHFGKPLYLALTFWLLAILLPFSLMRGFFLFQIITLRQKVSPFLRIALTASIWGAMELMQHRLPFFPPWGTPGQALAATSFMIQPAAIGGEILLSFLVILTAALLMEVLKSSKKDILRWIAPIAVISAIFIGAGVIPAHYTADTSAAVVQGNFSHKERWNGSGFSLRLQRYISYTQKSNADIVVWPETVLNVPAAMDREFWRTLQRELPQTSALLSGGTAHDGEKIYNSIYLLSRLGLQRYDKGIPLPYAETGLPGGLSRYYRAPERFDRGGKRKLLSWSEKSFATAICFESLYSPHIQEQVRRGASLIVVTAHDGWFGKWQQPALHLQASRLRAVEQGRFLLRAANTGYSGIIAPRGRYLARSPLDQEAVVHEKIGWIDAATVYNRFGDLPMVLLILLLFGYTGVKSYLDKYSS